MKSTACFRIKSISAMQGSFRLNSIKKEGATLNFFPVFPSLGKNGFIFYCHVRHVWINGWLLPIYVFTARFLQLYITSTSDRLVFVKMANMRL